MAITKCFKTMRNFIKQLLSFKVFKLWLVLVITHTTLSAQQDAQYTQYMYNTSVINPAYAGSRGMFSINAIHRTQWVGVNGAPTTGQISLNTPLTERFGFAFSYINDALGPSRESLVNTDFSYSINVSPRTKLAFGLKAGLSVLDVNFDDLAFNPLDSNAQNIDNRVSPIVGFGLYLHDNENWYLGLSSPNLLRTQHYTEDIQSSEITEELHAYLIGGYVFNLSRNTKFKPAFMVKGVTGSPLAVDVSANFLFLDKFTLGAAYRLDAAVSGLAAFQISDQLMIGYAYDYDTTEFNNYSNGSHELMLRFELFQSKKRAVNPRFF